jgi:truncated hemoglobin YjbI
MPFAIGEDERDQWVACMFLAMEVRRYRSGIARTAAQCLLQHGRFHAQPSSLGRKAASGNGLFAAQQAAPCLC